MQTSVGRRLEQALNDFHRKDYESSLVHFFPALDKTAKKRRPPKAGVGQRIKGFLSDEEDFISFLAIQNIIKVTVEGVSFSKAIYDFGRTSVMHEGELDPRLQIIEGGNLMIGHTWQLPSSYVGALIIAVMACEENRAENFSRNYVVHIHGKPINTEDIWGNRNLLSQALYMPVSI